MTSKKSNSNGNSKSNDESNGKSNDESNGKSNGEIQGSFPFASLEGQDDDVKRATATVIAVVTALLAADLFGYAVDGVMGGE
jgi:hypothetical protein